VVLDPLFATYSSEKSRVISARCMAATANTAPPSTMNA
jgi:hypothetical protein